MQQRQTLGEKATTAMNLRFVIGFAAGYVLGSKAGTERYNQIVDLTRKAMGTEPAQQLTDEVRIVAERVGEKTAEGMHRVSEKVMSHDHGNGASTPSEQDINLTETGTPPTPGGLS